MTSKHYKWQQRWRMADGTATHDTGLVVRLAAGRAVADNAAAVQADLAVHNGPHNAPAMLQRLLREAAQVLGVAEPTHG